MRIRRHRSLSETDTTVLQTSSGSGWRDLDDAELESSGLAWLSALAPCDGRGEANEDDRDAPVLPLQPRSFRDCSLYEAHWVQSSRGYARRFMPLAHAVARGVEAVTRRPFPAFRPHPLALEQPVYYFGNHLTFVPSGTPVRAPSYTRALDYELELELGWVLARPLFNATPEEVLHAIGGFVVVNDFSARDVQRQEMRTGLGPQKSKHFLSSMSETLVTAEALLPRIEALDAYVEINGRCVSRTSTRGMCHGLGAVVAHLSRDERLFPGELIATGTLPGGSGMETGHWLANGDVLRLVIDDVGEIQHRIAT